MDGPRKALAATLAPPSGKKAITQSAACSPRTKLGRAKSRAWQVAENTKVATQTFFLPKRRDSRSPDRQTCQADSVATEQGQAQPLHPVFDPQGVLQVEGHQDPGGAAQDVRDQVADEQDPERTIAQHTTHARDQGVGLFRGEPGVLRNAPAEPGAGEREQHRHGDGKPEEDLALRLRLRHAPVLDPGDHQCRAGGGEGVSGQRYAIAVREQTRALVIVRRELRTPSVVRDEVDGTEQVVRHVRHREPHGAFESRDAGRRGE